MDAAKNNTKTLDAEQVTQVPEAQDTKNNTPQKDNSKKPVYKQWWFWVIIVVAVLIMGGIGASSGNKNAQDSNDTANSNSQDNPSNNSDNGSNESSKDTETNTSTESENSTAENNDSGYKVGETITYKDSKVTVTNVIRNASTGNEFVTPEDGKEYVQIDINFVNTTTSKKSFYPSDWKLQDSNGVIKDISFSATAMLNNGFTSSIDLAGNGKWSGSMIFEVPAGDTNLQLQYTPSLFSKTTIINL